MYKFIFIIFQIFTANHCFGQIYFEKYFSSNDKHVRGNSLCALQNNHFAVTGTVEDFSSGRTNLFVGLFNEFGDTLWTKILIDTIDLSGEEIIIDKDSNLLIVGNRGTELLLVKFNLQGNILIEKSYAVAFPYGLDMPIILNAIDSGIIIAAAYAHLITTQNISLLLKLDKFGGITWSKLLYPHSALHYIIHSDSGYVGCSGNIIAKMNFAGNVQWAYSYDYGLGAPICDIIKTSDSGFAAMGFIDHFPSVDWFEGFLLKTDTVGNIQWSKGYGTPAAIDMQPFNVFQKSNGNYFLIGDMNYAPGYHSGLIETDSAGNALYHKAYQNWSGYLPPTKCVTTSDGIFLSSAGRNPNVQNRVAMWICKMDNNFNSNCGDTSTMVVTNILNPIKYPVTFSDSSIVLSENYLTLSQDSALNYIEFCASVGINYNPDSPEFKIYPNPTHDLFYIELPEENLWSDLVLLNHLGCLLQTFDLTSNRKQVDLRNYSDGAYFIKAKSPKMDLVKLILKY